MTKVYYIDYDSTGTICGIYWHANQCKHNLLAIELDDTHGVLQNNFNYIVQNSMLKDRVVDTNAIQLELKKNSYRSWRAQYLERYDLLGQWVARGDLDPTTNQPYGPIRQEEREFLLALRNFTESITLNTTINDYPTVPERLR